MSPPPHLIGATDRVCLREGCRLSAAASRDGLGGVMHELSSWGGPPPMGRTPPTRARPPAWAELQHDLVIGHSPQRNAGWHLSLWQCSGGVFIGTCLRPIAHLGCGSSSSHTLFRVSSLLTLLLPDACHELPRLSRLHFLSGECWFPMVSKVSTTSWASLHFRGWGRKGSASFSADASILDGMGI